jgi:hypothetical protein
MRRYNLRKTIFSGILEKHPIIGNIILNYPMTIDNIALLRDELKKGIIKYFLKNSEYIG